MVIIWTRIVRQQKHTVSSLLLYSRLRMWFYSANIVHVVLKIAIKWFMKIRPYT